MINIFKRLAPSYGNILRKYAINVWYGKKKESEFFEAAERYKKRYENALIKHYQSLGYPYDLRVIKKISNEWLADQLVIAKKIESITVEKQEEIEKELNQLTIQKQKEVKKLLSDAKKHEGRVVGIVSFSDNMESRAKQMGEDSAFDLSTMINHAVISDMSDVYSWKTQNDTAVRKTHRILSNKIFSFDDPPTTIDKYGHIHTGNPGTDWGCRCWSDVAKGNPLRNYIAREK